MSQHAPIDLQLVLFAITGIIAMHSISSITLNEEYVVKSELLLNQIALGKNETLLASPEDVLDYLWIKYAEENAEENAKDEDRTQEAS